MEGLRDMWNTIYKWTLGILLTGLVGFGLFFGVTIYLDIQEHSQAEEDNPEENAGDYLNSLDEEEEKTVTELSEEKFENAEHDEDLNPFGDPQDIKSVSESQVQDYIHQMSHQKVKASEKWGFYRITDERIKWLIEAVDANDYEHGEQYMHILMAWNKGAFDRADKHHNIIWEMQGGTIGKATGVMSLDEEEAYLESAREGSR